MNTEEIKRKIEEQIRTNDKQYITGDILQDVLLSMLNNDDVAHTLEGTEPGNIITVDVDGNYHAENLNMWIQNYESGISENNQRNIGLKLLGKFFSFFPKGKFPGWLPEEICRVIDMYNNDGLNESFIIQCLNNRSAHYCNDGNENNSLIEEYEKYAKIYEMDYPITASIFRKLSDYYNDEKQEQKERASHSMF